VDSPEKSNFSKSPDHDSKINQSSTVGTMPPKNTDSTNDSKMPIDKCGTLLLSTLQLTKIKEESCFNRDMLILTLSMIKKLTVSALSGCMNTIQIEINNIEYYLKTGWRAYKSHRKKKIFNLESHLRVVANYS
jgi:hypothetical protein